MQRWREENQDHIRKYQKQYMRERRAKERETRE